MSYPTAIVLGIDTPIGLTIVRELGERGVPVHGIAKDRRAVGLHSRYLASHSLRPADERTLIAEINRIAREAGPSLLLTVSESDIRMLNARRGELQGVKPLIAAPAQTAIAFDKAASCRAAEAVGIRVPKTIEVASVDEIAAVSRQVDYPVILKWANTEEVRQSVAALGLRLSKFEYCYDPDALVAALRRYAPLGRFPLAQSFCAGYGLGHMIFMHDGAPLLCFQHRRLHEWPPEGGISTLCESLPAEAHGELMEKSVALLRNIGWSGAAMVEYRYDPATDTAVFMEINGRFWGSQPLAYHAGACFAWLTYSVLGLGKVPAIAPYRTGLRCRYMVPELHRLATVIARRQRIQNRALQFRPVDEILAFLGDFLSPRQRYYIFSWRDPAPFLHDLSMIMWKMLAASAGRMFQASGPQARVGSAENSKNT